MRTRRRLRRNRRARRRLGFVSLFIAFLLFFNAIFPAVFSRIALAGAPDPLAGFKISDAKITLNGTPIENITTPLKQNATVVLEYTWWIDDTDFIKDNDTISIDVPEALNLGGSNINGSLLGEGGTIFGTWLLDAASRKLILTLNAVPKDLSNVRGTVQFTLNFKVDQMVVKVPYELKVPISGGLEKTYTLIFETPNSPAVDKSGIQSPGDANVLTWTVDINRNLKTLNGPAVTDKIDPLLYYNPGSLKVYNLDVMSNGTVVQGGQLTEGADYNIGYDNGTNLLTVTFSGQIKTAYRLVYDTSIDASKIDTSKTTFNYSNEASFNWVKDTATVTVTRGPLIVKNSLLDRAFNARRISWSISVNQAQYPLTNAKVEDTVPSGLTIDKSSLKVYKMPGRALLTENADYTLAYGAGDRQFTVTLGNIAQEHIIEYDTTINEDEMNNNSTSVSFTNSAKLYQGPDGNVVTNTASKAAAVPKGRTIYKTGSASIGYNNEKYITWTADINFSEVNLATRIFTDVIGSNHKLDAGFSIEVYPIVIDHSKTSNNITVSPKLVKDVDYTIGYGADPEKEFNIDFLANITQPYRVVYRTTITNKDIQSFSNTGYIGPVGGTPSYARTVSTTIANTYSKTSTGVDYSTKVLPWRINVNPIKQGIQNLVITDTLTPGLMMTDAQFAGVSITKGGVSLIKDTDYTLSATRDAGNKIKGFVISFVNEVNDAEYIIIYSTTMDPDVLPDNGNLNYGNTSVFTYTGGNQTVNKNPVINPDALHNGNKSGSLDAANKKINWTVNTNYLSKNINGFEVTDTMIGNQRLAAGSVKIYNYSIDASGNITEGSLVDAAAEGFVIEEDAEGKSFKVTYPASIDKPYRIKYTTQFIGISQTTYTNTAVTNKNESYTASVNYADGDKFVSKTGIRNGIESVDWKATLNKSQSTINSFTLTDTLSEGLQLVENSFVVKKLDNTVVDFNSMFTLNVRPRVLSTDPQVFDLISKVPISETYTIDYRTNIILDEILENKVFNNLTFSGEQVISGATQSSVTIAHTFITGSGTGQGEVGSFKLKKVDESGNPLQGARFEFYKGAKLLGVLVTDANGEATASRLKYASYTLKEIEAPSGYQIVNTDTNITINNTIQKSITVQNDSFRTLEIIKTQKDKPTVYLGNAVFEILDSNNVVLHTVTTDNAGKASAKLPYGVYKVREKTAPSGYIKDSGEYTVSILSTDKNADLSPKTIYTLAVENTVITYSDGPSYVPPPAPAPLPKPVFVPKPSAPAPTPAVSTTKETPVKGKVDTPEVIKTEIGKQPINGKAEVDKNGNWIYTPNQGYVGKDEFTMSVTQIDGSEKKVLIQVTVEDTLPKKNILTVLPRTGQGFPWLSALLGFIAMILGVFLIRDR